MRRYAKRFVNHLALEHVFSNVINSDSMLDQVINSWLDDFSSPNNFKTRVNTCHRAEYPVYIIITLFQVKISQYVTYDLAFQIFHNFFICSPLILVRIKSIFVQFTHCMAILDSLHNVLLI